MNTTDMYDICENLMDISETLQTLREQIEALAYLFIPEDEDADRSDEE